MAPGQHRPDRGEVVLEKFHEPGRERDFDRAPVLGLGRRDQDPPAPVLPDQVPAEDQPEEVPRPQGAHRQQGDDQPVAIPDRMGQPRASQRCAPHQGGAELEQGQGMAQPLRLVARVANFGPQLPAGRSATRRCRWRGRAPG